MPFVLIEATPPEASTLAPSIKDDALIERLALRGHDDAIVLEWCAASRSGQV